jgi:acetolactate synthase regulatory subunit
MTEIVAWVSKPSTVCARVLAVLDKRGYQYRKVQVTTDGDRARPLQRPA